MNSNSRERFSERKSNIFKFDKTITDSKDSDSRLFTINSDIERLYKKYSDIKKKRQSKEKTQQILVNRIKYLKNEVKRSVSKKEKEKNKQKKYNDMKISVKIEESYINNKQKNKYKIKDKYKYNTLSNENVNIMNLNNKENNMNEQNISNNMNTIENLLKKNRYNIGNNNSNNNIYIIINNPKNFCTENILNNNLDNNINYRYNNNKINKSKEGQNIKSKISHKKNKSENNFINISKKGENIILMNANESKIQDIINSINNIANVKSSNSNNINTKYNQNNKYNNRINENNKKIITRNISNNITITKNEDANDDFIRPNFLNLYNNEDTLIMKQQIDINTFNKTESSIFQGTESSISNNILKDKSIDDNNNINIKQKFKKNNVINNNIINNEIQDEIKLNNFLFNTMHSISCSSSETKINFDKNNQVNKVKKNNSNNNLNNKNILTKKNNYNISYIKNKNNEIRSYHNNNIITHNNNHKFGNLSQDKKRNNHFRNDSYNNSIENKRRFLGLEFKPYKRREFSIQTEQNSEKKKKILNRVNKFNNLYEKINLIKVKKRDEYKKVIKASKNKNMNDNNIRNLIENKTLTNFNRAKKRLNTSENK